MALPPGVSARNFADATKQFQETVGKEWVFTSDEDVALYRDAYSPLWGEPEERVASAAVAPDRVEQVQQVVKIANTYKIPIYPVSTGRNLGYGGSAPTYSGSVVLDLKRMNRILDVSERNASCLVEPGVSYFDLVRYIDDKGYKVWVDIPDPGWGSPIGNSLDHGWWIPAAAVPEPLRLPLRNGSRVGERRAAAHWHGCAARRRPGSNISSGTARGSMGCSRNRTSASSPRWGFG